MKNFSINIITILCLELVLLQLGACDTRQDNGSSILLMEIDVGGKIKKFEFDSESIEKVGINDRLGKTRIEVMFHSKYHNVLKEITQKNKGNNITIKFGTEIIASGPIIEPIYNGNIIIFSDSKEDAEKIISKLGRMPDYYLGFTREELEDAQTYIKPANNPWIEKAVIELTSQNNEKAEEFVKKAIEEEPFEPSHYGMLSAIYLLQGEKELAFGQLLKAEKLIKKEDVRKYPGIYHDIGKHYSETGEFDKALEIYMKYLSSGGNALNIHMGLAELYEKMGDYSSAAQEFALLSKSEDEYFKKIGLDGVDRINQKD